MVFSLISIPEMNVRTLVPFLVSALTLCSIQFTGAAADDLSDSIRALLRDHIDLDKKSVGIVVGIVDERGGRVISYGQMDNEQSSPVDGDTVFDICSITKTFTTLLLQGMVEAGKMDLDAPAAKYLPKSVRLPTWHGKEITLLNLATHTSGLPRDIGNLEPQNWRDPYIGYTINKFYAFLSGATLHWEPGTKYEYSNVGMQLLAHAIELKAGTNYETLVRDRICRPLQMESTCITLSRSLQARLAPGHNPPNQRVPPEHFETLLGAGGLHSTANDLLKYLAANLGLRKSSLIPIMQKTHAIRFPHADSELDMALGWSVSHFPGADFMGHSGRGIGYRALIAFDPKRKRGVVVLSNSYDDDRLYDIGWTLLQTDWESARSAKVVKIDHRLYDGYAGQYQLGTNFLISVRHQGKRLLIQPQGKLTAELLPASETNFFGRVTSKPVSFVIDAHGRATGLIVQSNGKEYAAIKTSDEPLPLPEAPKKHFAISADPKICDTFVGRYKFSSKEMLVVRSYGNHLVVIFGAQGFEFYPESPTDFFCPYADLQISFERNQEGVVTGLIAHQLGNEEHAKRLPIISG
jgi:D-alanyl-D-alanine-carboxypeptidase/D-alanyl-D-alanine-endopeptidase